MKPKNRSQSPQLSALSNFFTSRSHIAFMIFKKLVHMTAERKHMQMFVNTKFHPYLDRYSLFKQQLVWR